MCGFPCLTLGVVGIKSKQAQSARKFKPTQSDAPILMPEISMNGKSQNTAVQDPL